MRVLITGAGGFIGRALTAELLARGRLSAGGGGLGAIAHLTLADRAPAAPPRAAGVAVETATGDLADPAFLDGLAAGGFDSVFHLAATLTVEAERDPEAAYAANVEPVRRLIAACDGRAAPRLVFASSIAVFGGPLPETVDDTVRPTPTTTYGAHKAIVELLLADASRRGRIDGRALRLPIVLLRPGAPAPAGPGAAVSERLAGVVRAALSGRDAACPLAADTRLPVASAGAVARALAALHDVPPAALPVGRALNLPALTVGVAEMVAAAGRRGGSAGAVTYAPDPALQAIVDGWPRRFVSAHATRLGLRSDADFAAIVDDHLAAGGRGA